MSEQEPLELPGALDFKSAEELDLTPRQYCSLVKTLALLESGALDYENKEYKIARFSMLHWRSAARCGTVCCIGGTASIVGERDGTGERLFPHTADMPRQLRRVFYPGDQLNDRSHLGWKGTTKDAAQVLRHYLNTGIGDWGLPYRNK